jgi:hypothetical protein
MAKSQAQTIATKLLAHSLILANASVEGQEAIMAAMIKEAHEQYPEPMQDKALELISMFDKYLQTKD